jgi:hypothetical protein
MGFMVKENSPAHYSFSSFGVGVCLDFDDAGLLDRFKESLQLIFKGNLSEKARSPNDQVISARRRDDLDSFLYTFRGEEFELDAGEIRLFKLLRTLVRVTVAANTEEKLFIHAGAVSWKGRGLILPAHSNSGKTSLVIELCKLGALYLSDEYAVLDSNGMLFPFPKHLSVRGEGGRFDQQDVDISELGGLAGKDAVPMQMVLFSEFSQTRFEWIPKRISSGEGLLRLIPHMIAMPVNPAFCLRMGSAAVREVPIFEAERGDAKDFAPKILELLEKSAFLG